jgi:hypothetical protein
VLGNCKRREQNYRNIPSVHGSSFEGEEFLSKCRVSENLNDVFQDKENGFSLLQFDQSRTNESILMYSS